MRADEGAARVEEVDDELFHLSDIQGISALDRTAAGGIRHHAMTHRLRRRHVLLVESARDVLHHPVHVRFREILRTSRDTDDIRACLLEGDAKTRQIRLMLFQEREILGVGMEEVRHQNLLHRDALCARARRS